LAAAAEAEETAAVAAAAEAEDTDRKGGLGGSDAASTARAQRLVGGPLLAPSLPPARTAWATRAVCLDAGKTLEVPLLLAEPSVALVDMRPGATGLVLEVLAASGAVVCGPVNLLATASAPAMAAASLEPAALSATAAVEHVNGTAAPASALSSSHTPPLELEVLGSGVFTLRVRNTNLWTAVSFSARLEVAPVAARRTDALRQRLSVLQAEREQLGKHATELAASEATLAQRLWEVQETRRRHAAMDDQLMSAIGEIESALMSSLGRPAE